MSKKIVVASDLGLYRGLDILMFDGIDDYATVPASDSISIPFYSDVDGGASWKVIGQIGSYQDLTGILFRLEAGSLRVSENGGDPYGNSVVFAYTFDKTLRDLSIVNNNGVIDVGYNGEQKQLTLGAVTTWAGRTLQLMRRDATDNASGCMAGVQSGAHSYINKGDFGSANLPSVPAGNDGTTSGAIWWKKGIDQFFDDWVNYNSQLPVTPVEFQDVRRVDIFSPNTNAVEWGLYDDTWLTVTQQIDTIIITGLIGPDGEDMNDVRRSILGSGLGATTHTFGSNDFPTQISTLSTGVLKVKRFENDFWSDITVQPIGTMYSIGKIKEVDIANSTPGLVAAIEFGIENA